MNTIKDSVATESKCKKLTIAIWAFIHIGIGGLIFTFEFLRHDNVTDT